MEVEAVDEGTLGQILVPEGTADVAVNTPIAVILAEGEDAGALNNFHAEAPAQQQKGRGVRTPRRRRTSPPPRRRRAPAEPQVRGRGAAAARAPEPDVPEGTEMVTMTMREALRDAMAEEMRRDDDVFVMGEEVAEYQGAYKVTQGLLQEFGADRVIDTPITEHGFAGLGDRRGARRPQADRRVHDLQFRHAGDGPADQFGRQDALHVGRPDGLLDRVPRTERRGRARRRPAQPGLFGLVLAHSRPHGDRALYGGRRQGPAQVRDPLSQSGHLPGERDPLRPFVSGAEARRLRGADRQGQDGAAGQARHPGRLVDGHELCAQGRRGARQEAHQRRGDRPAHAAADGHRDRRRSR